MVTFTKPAQSISQQIALLKSRGLTIGDEAAAEHALSHISYYRLRAYWLPFEKPAPNPNHLLKDGTSLELVLKLYDFDRRLRLLLLDGIELLEVAARGSWAHHIAMKYGPHGHLNASLYPDAQKFSQNLKDLQREVKRSKDLFIQHYKNKYTSPPQPPVWMISEIMSFGLLSKWQSSLGPNVDRKAIAKPSGLRPSIYMPFIHHLATVRNACAHHSRTWNRQFAVTAKIPTHPSELAASVNRLAPAQIYNTLTMMAFVLGNVAPSSTWRLRVMKLLGTHPLGDLSAMGFPLHWAAKPVWKRQQGRTWRDALTAASKLFQRLFS